MIVLSGTECYEKICEKMMKGDETTFKKMANHIKLFDNFEDAYEEGMFDEEWFEDLIIELADRIKFRRELRNYLLGEEES